MSGRILAIRPEPGLTGTLARGHARGLAITGLPLSQVEPVAWRAPARAYNGLLIGSANALRHAGAELEKLRGLPVLAVGERTAEAARQAGWPVEACGEGGLQQVLDALPDAPRTLLRLAGEQRTRIEIPAPVAIDTVTVYRVVHRTLSAAQARLFSPGSVVLLHSGEAARHFAHECTRCGIDKSGIALAALAPRIADAAGSGWEAVRIADAPQDEALLAIVAELCQGR